jgi:chromosomal replication initiator protein
MSHDHPSVAVIIHTVASVCGVTALDVRSDRRQARVVLARHTGMWLARNYTPLSYPAIGRAFGDRDHSTVMYAVRHIERAMEDDPAFGAQVRELARLFGAGENAPT